RMFPSSGHFSELMCPHGKICERVYCPFWHPPQNARVIVERVNGGLPPSISYTDSSYNDSFYGYNAYVADTSSQSIYAPEIQMGSSDIPTTSYQASYGESMEDMGGASTSYRAVEIKKEIKEEEEDIEIIGEVTKKKKKSIRELPLPKLSPQKDKSKLLDEYMSKVSELNRKIEELQKDSDTKRKKKGESTKREYVPTPLCEIESRKKEKREEERKKREEEERREKKREEEKKKEERKKAEDKSESMLIDSLFEDYEEQPMVKKRREERTVPVREEKKTLTAAQIAAAKSRVARPAAAAAARQTIAPKKNISAAQQVQRRIENAAEKERLKELEAKEGGKQQQRPLTEGEKIAQLTGGRTNASSVSKGETRKAHSDIQSSSRVEKPQLRDAADPKIPMNVRLSFLDKFFTHFLKTCTSRQVAIQSAEVEEKAVKDKTSSKNGYTVAAVNALKRLRDESNARATSSSKPMKMSHSAILAGRKGEDISVGIKRNSNGGVSRLTGNERELRLHSALEKYILKEEELVVNGYPRWETKEKMKVTIELHEMDKKRGKRSFVDDHDLRRQCSRCSIDFNVNREGKPQSARCTYHHSRMVKKRTRGEGWTSVFGCCDSDLSTKGCTIADTHVFDTLRVSDLEAFIESPLPWGECDPRSKKVYAMDCEMVYTTWGPALARVSVVDLNDDLVLDLLVRPSHLLIDANSRFSGLQAEQVEAAEASLEDARERLFELVNSQTILIGHSLESDLKAMRVVHHRVVDTSVVFPHRAGPPLKRALRNLAGEILMKIIQEDVSGHDSKEDSSACMQLMLHKLKQDGVHL
ncbi:hypothetical protein PMAYCL1PPCAC_06658, partial [Pristionchus mayeri]